MSGSSSYKNYRESLQDKEAPCIPYVGRVIQMRFLLLYTHPPSLVPLRCSSNGLDCHE